MEKHHKKFITYLAYAMQIVSFFVLIFWVQLSDPECILESNGFFSQFQLCDPKYSADFQQPSIWYLALIAAVFIIGKVMLIFSDDNP
jgi:hypothetical protein